MQIEGFSGYEFNEDGSVYSYKSNKYLKPSLDKDGYLQLDCIDDNGKRKRHSLHHWICIAFYGEPPSSQYEAMHLDENPLNNHKDNLKWGTHKENINYGNRTNKNAKAHNKKIGQFSLDDNLLQIFSSIKEASEKTNTSYTGIIKAAKDKIKTSNGFKWHYI